MKRNKNIQPLSRDHHFGLLFCWKLRRGLTKQIELERMSRYVEYFWKASLHQHFIEEETILFSTVKDKLCDDAHQQHIAISLLVQKINGNEKTNPQVYKDLADMVDQHIRFEERTLFPHLESILSPKQMLFIGLELEKLHRETFEETFEDQFWE